MSVNGHGIELPSSWLRQRRSRRGDFARLRSQIRFGGGYTAAGVIWLDYVWPAAGGTTTVDYQVGASSSDSHMTSITNDSGRSVTVSGAVSLTAATLSPGSHGSGDEWSVAARIDGVAVAQGSTINSATFELRCQNTWNASPNVIKFYISAQAADNAGALSATSGDLNTTARPRTTATVIVDWSSLTVDTWYSVDVTSVVQEIVNRAGWASGNAIVILVDTHADTTLSEWQDFYSYDGAAASAPKLSITYASSGGGISGSLSSTDDSDTLAATGTLRIAATLSSTEADDTLAATGALRIAATLSATEDADTLAATGTVGSSIAGTLAATEADDTLSATGTLRIAATLAATEDNDTLAATGALRIAGTLSTTDADDTASSTGVLRISGTLASTEADDTLAGAGALRIVGSLSATEADDALAANGVHGATITATLAATEADDSLSATAALRIAGSLTATSADDTLAASGALRIAGALAVTEAGDTAAATGALRITGALSATESDDTLASSGGLRVSGALAVVDNDDVLTAIAIVLLRGSLAVTEDGDTLDAFGSAFAVEWPGARNKDRFASRGRNDSVRRPVDALRGGATDTLNRARERVPSREYDEVLG